MGPCHIFFFQAFLFARMEVEQYLNRWKELYNHLLGFIDNQDGSQIDYQNLISDINKQNITENKNEFQHLLQLLVLISIDHYRYSNFFSKLDQILTFFSPKIAETFSNSEIFDIFYKSKRLLLFLIKNGIFKFAEQLKEKIKNQNYHDYFSESDKNHEEAKEKGENDSYICQLIREDSIEDFITYIHKTGCPLSSTIKPSIYETNSMILHRQLTLLDYAFFCGSIQVVEYLLSQGEKLTATLWIYAIHSNNAEIIQLLEDKNTSLKVGVCYGTWLKEALKCQHNDVATYIQENYNQFSCTWCFQFFNYSKLSECEINNEFFLCACKYNYIELVKLLLNDARIDVNYTPV